MKTISQISISHSAALTLVTKAEDVASTMGITIAACVVDIHGRVKAKMVMDGAGIHSDELVERKAKTALLGLSSQALADAIKDETAMLHSLSQLNSITLLAGGEPLFAEVDGENQLIGAFAIGGATTQQDADCAKACLGESS